MAAYHTSQLNACVLLHSALGNHSQMAPVRAAIEKHTTVYDFDFEGHGFENQSNRFSLDSLVKQLDTFIHEKKLHKPTVIGYSMGGYVAITLAAQKPGLISRVITYGTKLAWTSEFAEKESQKLNPEKMLEKVPAFASKLAAQYGNPHWKNVVEETAAFIKSLPNKPIPFTSMIVKYKLLLGTEDRMVSLDETVQAASLSINGKYQSIEGAGHEIGTVPAACWLSVLESEI